MVGTMSEHFRPSWGKRFHEQTVHYPLDLRLKKMERGGVVVEMMGGGFLATTPLNLMDRLIEKKHLGVEVLHEVFLKVMEGEERTKVEEAFTSWWQSRLQSDGLVWQRIPARDQVEVG